MSGYRDSAQRTAEAMEGGYYHTGDVASRDDDGYITYVGRTDDVFKASDYRISPFELESVLIEHEAVAEAAVVPSPDALRLAVPKAYVPLAPGQEPTRSRRSRSWPLRGSGWRRTSASGDWSSPICRRRSPARSAGSSCAPRSHSGWAPATKRCRGRPVSSGRMTCPSFAPEPGAHLSRNVSTRSVSAAAATASYAGSDRSANKCSSPG